jgi:hypothetical protein
VLNSSATLVLYPRLTASDGCEDCNENVEKFAGDMHSIVGSSAAKAAPERGTSL